MVDPNASSSEGSVPETPTPAPRLDARFSTDYLTFTVCPSDEYQFRRKGTNRFTLYSREFEKGFLANMSRCVKHVQLYPDLSIPKFLQTPQAGKVSASYPRIHYHGIIKLKDAPLFYLMYPKYYSTLGRVEIDTIVDMEKWLAYCKKFILQYPRYESEIIDWASGALKDHRADRWKKYNEPKYSIQDDYETDTETDED